MPSYVFGNSLGDGVTSTLAAPARRDVFWACAATGAPTAMTIQAVASDIFICLLTLPLLVLHKQVADLPSQTFFGRRPGIGEVHICARGCIEPRPLHELSAVGIAGLGEVGPVFLHLRRVLLIRVVVFPHTLPNRQRAEDKWNFR